MKPHRLHHQAPVFILLSVGILLGTARAATFTAGGKEIINVANGTAPTSAATVGQLTAYVESSSGGLADRMDLVEANSISSNDWATVSNAALTAVASESGTASNLTLTGNVTVNGSEIVLVTDHAIAGATSAITTGLAAGTAAYAISGGAVGYAAYATSGGAVGYSAYAELGGAVGYSAYAESGGAIGSGANATSGFSGGSNAVSNVDSIQLGTGNNTTAKSLQVYNYQMMDATGNIPAARISSAGDTRYFNATGETNLVLGTWNLSVSSGILSISNDD